jgi:hypothetical protein
VTGRHLYAPLPQAPTAVGHLVFLEVWGCEETQTILEDVVRRSSSTPTIAGSALCCTSSRSTSRRGMLALMMPSPIWTFATISPASMHCGRPLFPTWTTTLRSSAAVRFPDQRVRPSPRFRVSCKFATALPSATGWSRGQIARETLDPVAHAGDGVRSSLLLRSRPCALENNGIHCL